MSVIANVSRFERVRSLLKQAAAGTVQAFGGLELWSMSRDQLIAAKLMGLSLIKLNKPAHSCCHPSSTTSDTGGSALVSGLRGIAPFDDSQFPRLPWGRPAMIENEVEEIAAWIADGAPASDVGETIYNFPANAWKASTTRIEISNGAASDLLGAYAEYEGLTNNYRYQNGELRQRMNIDCMSSLQIEKLRFAFREICCSSARPRTLPTRFGGTKSLVDLDIGFQ